MKKILLLACCCQALLASAQHLKTRIDKKTGDTTTFTWPKTLMDKSVPFTAANYVEYNFKRTAGPGHSAPVYTLWLHVITIKYTYVKFGPQNETHITFDDGGTLQLSHPHIDISKNSLATQADYHAGYDFQSTYTLTANELADLEQHGIKSVMIETDSGNLNFAIKPGKAAMLERNAGLIAGR